MTRQGRCAGPHGTFGPVRPGHGRPHGPGQPPPGDGGDPWPTRARTARQQTSDDYPDRDDARVRDYAAVMSAEVQPDGVGAQVEAGPFLDPVPSLVQELLSAIPAGCTWLLPVRDHAGQVVDFRIGAVG